MSSYNHLAKRLFVLQVKNTNFKRHLLRTLSCRNINVNFYRSIHKSTVLHTLTRLKSCSLINQHLCSTKTSSKHTYTRIISPQCQQCYTSSRSSSSSESPCNSNVEENSRVIVDDQPPSWLFVSPAAAGAYGAQVNVDLDLEKRLKGDSLNRLQANITARGLGVDLASLVNNFSRLTRMKEEKVTLVLEKESLLKQLKELKEMTPSHDTSTAAESLVQQMKDVKNEISKLKSSWDLEEEVMLEALRLPNDLHPTTPLEESQLLHEDNMETVEMKYPDQMNHRSHVDIAQRFDLIKFSNVGPQAYYLKYDLALAEMALTSAVCDYLQVQGYHQISGPEFVKTPIVEGCGIDVRDGNKVLTMIDPHKTVVEPMNHINGVSLNMFAAYVAKTCISDAALPVQMFACGRRYQKSSQPGLFGATQKTQASIFSCVREEDVDKQYDACVKVVENLWAQLGFHSRSIQVCAKHLQKEEKRRINFEAFSPSLQHFVPVGHVSDLGDYVSRRLMVSHNQNHADIRTAKLVHMVHGAAVDITSVLALWLEHSYTDTESFSLKDIPLLNTDKAS